MSHPAGVNKAGKANKAGGKPRHIPQRTCVVCRSTAEKRSLTRLVRVESDGIQTVQIDPTGKQNGRGAYLCDQPACWQRATDSDILEKALRMTLAQTDRERLREATPKS